MPSHVFPIFNLAAVDILSYLVEISSIFGFERNRNWVAIFTFVITDTMRKI
ncbi:Hypothetical protein FKW44_001445 [Caligus rogercresseyi]|uniref:Uncharacterized protein n=1 Tax=Caligus rogercresseyi TaxID=217165 RepID=A0A7T8H2G8_CALRO|nr:Hypothetical protein FKW44_016827 [Caligus rogercresseyi]QQP50438.1 Hypothetical protein FKW44_011444 [Caligus rogercresseyi]QQP55476.1 Hypothetical protein FKW44_008678 [Caligus rogercresseyi]QQP56693.1 Hypothetical protein FKW44_001445 [Caligus rogercresseyi]